MKNKLLIEQILFCSALLVGLKSQGQAPLNFINDSTDARFRVEVETKHYAMVEAGTVMSEIPLHLRDELIPTSSTIKMATGVNNQGEVFTEFEQLEYNLIEDWIVPPAYSMITPMAFFAYDEQGGLIHHWQNTTEEQTEFFAFANQVNQDAFRPVLTFFPSIRDRNTEQFQINGGIVFENPDKSFVLQQGQEITTIDPVNLTIKEEFFVGSEKYEVITAYVLMAPYGYTPIHQLSISQETDPVDAPWRFVTETTYSNHVIEDPTNRIPKYSEEAHLLIHPVPIGDDFRIELRGVENDIVSQIQVRDYFGNLITTITNPSVQDHLIEVNSSTFPNGMLILQVYTAQGIYNEIIFK
jgi:energy-coupling factor transporter ATP-binding protein EcfA2